MLGPEVRQVNESVEVGWVPKSQLMLNALTLTDPPVNLSVTAWLWHLENG